MYKTFIPLLAVGVLLLARPIEIQTTSAETRPVFIPQKSETEQLYDDIGLKDVVHFDVFERAMAGYRNIPQKRKEVMTLIDFSKPSTDERLYVLDIENKQLLFRTHVSHGQKSGENYAVSFSNRKGSHQSSLGFYLTDQTYQGGNGYSLLLNGLEEGFNDKARERAVVIHGAAYANPAVIPGSGRLGRSHGCPALPHAVTKPVIDAIKEGSVLFIYADDPNYFSNSPILSGRG